MIPPFDLEGGLLLASFRLLSVVGLVAAAGSLVYAAAIRPPGAPQAALRRLGLAAVALALAGALAWLLAQTRDMAGGLSPGDVGSVLSATRFGHLLAGRLVLLTAAGAALAAHRFRLAALLGVTALLLQAGHSHAMAMDGLGWLLAASAVHLLAAGLWLGGLPALLLVLRTASPAMAAAAARRFSRLGIACVAALLATATVQARLLVVNVPGLVGTAYGWMACLKIVLFAVLIALAARNRIGLTPRLGQGAAAIGRLRAAIMLEVALGLAVLAAAAVLTELQPAMHVQPVWPFGWLPSLEAVRADGDIAREVGWATAGLAAGLALLAAAVLLRRRRWPALAAAGGALLLMAACVPHLAPLAVPAVPTAFYASPTGFSATAIVAGSRLYSAHCAVCHGAGGGGDGPAAHALAVPPENLNAPHLWMHSDGEMFWWLTHGIAAPDGKPAMPGFPALADSDRWALIDYVRAHNGGRTLDAAGRWGTQMQAPDLPLECGSVRSLSALRGAPVLLVLGAPTAADAMPGVRMVGLAGDTACRSAVAEAAGAYAIAAPGAGAVLIDANGWLRQAGPNAAALRAQIGPVAAAPLPLTRPAMDMDMDMDPGMKM